MLTLKKDAPSPLAVADPPPVPGEPGLEWVGGGGTDLSRIISLSDGVFGFAMTFLVISLALPTLSTATGALPPFSNYLGNLESGILDYALAFMVVASWWTIHHQLFSALRRYDAILIRLNSLFLFFVSITPFTLAVVFQYGPHGFLDTSEPAKYSVMLFALFQVAAGFLLFAIWRHAIAGRKLVDPALPEVWIRETERASQIRIAWFVASIGVAAALPLVAEFVWLGPMIAQRRRLFRIRKVHSAQTAPTPVPSLPSKTERS